MKNSKSIPVCASQCDGDAGPANAGHTSRRIFMLSALATGAVLASAQASAQAPAAGPPLTEADPQAAALGFKLDNTKVDKAKYPQHTATQICGTCNFYQGKPTDATAPCQLFANKTVPQKGWCAAYAKKA